MTPVQLHAIEALAFYALAIAMVAAFVCWFADGPLRRRDERRERDAFHGSGRLPGDVPAETWGAEPFDWTEAS